MKHDRTTESTITAAVTEALKEGRLSEAEGAELEGLLLSLAAGDLTRRASTGGPVARAVDAAILSLAGRLDAAELAASQFLETLESGGQATYAAGVTEPDQALTARDAAARALEVANGRLAELSLLAARLAEVAGQANMAALNISVELSRDGTAKETTLTALADEVRRLAERTDAATQRLPRVVGALKESQDQASELLLGHRLVSAEELKGLQTQVRRQEEMVAQAAGLARSLRDQILLSAAGGESGIAALRARLRDVLGSLKDGQVEVVAFARALSELEGALLVGDGPGADEESS